MRVLSSIVLLLLVISCVIAAPCDSYSYINRVDVSTTAELTSALGAALPGDLIVLADGTYTKTFTTTGVSGTQANPIILCGGVNAIITAGSQTSSSAALRFFNSNYWVLTGFSVTNAKKGVELETANYFVVDGLTITNIGGQCVYLKTTATNNVIKNSVISGCTSGSNGKGIYIGANSAGDASNYNSVIDNVFSGTTAENLDVRDSTIGTQVVRNIFSGDATAASIGQIVAIRGNNAAVTNNTFINGQNAFRYGLRTSSLSFNGVLWGNLNVFSGNYFDVPQATDNSLYIHNYKGDGSGNVVYCNNEGTPLANGKPFTNDDRGCTELPHEEEPTTPPVATPAPTTAPTAAPTYDFETPARPNGTTPYKTCSSFYALRTVQVSNASELASALADATAGDVIVLADGVYNGQFVSEYKSGTEANPIVLCGTNNAVLTTNSVVTGSALEIHFASHWYLSGFTIYNSKKGLQFETVQHSTIDGLFAYFIGEEAVHIKLNSSYNTIKNSVISYTGENTASDRRGYGEGVYVGTSEGNGAWDRSDYNQLLFNYIGPNVTAEGADIKEYTTGTFVYGNIFNGYGLSGMNSATTVLAMKGNYGIARNNSFYFAIDYATRTSYRSGWGNYNVYDGNRAYVPGAKSGYYIHYPTSDGSGNVVLCNNWVYGSTAFANNGVVCKDSVPVAVPNATTDTCSSVVTFTHTLANQWSDGRYVYSQFNVAISNSQPIHSLNFKASFEIFNNLVRKESDRTFVLADDREYIPAGSGFTFSYVVQGTEKATITVLSGDCAPLPVTCAITVTQKKLNSWSDNRADFYQYGFDFTSNRNVASNTLDLTITLPTGAYPTGQWNLATSDSTATILATSTVHYTASLWGLQPGGSFYGAHGYTITVPRGTVVPNPLFVVNGCN